MSTLIPVRIVRPKISTASGIGMLTGSLVGLFLRAWLLMLVVPFVGDFHPGYWASFAACVAVSALLGDRSTYRLWTSDADR